MNARQRTSYAALLLLSQNKFLLTYLLVVKQNSAKLNKLQLKLIKILILHETNKIELFN